MTDSQDCILIDSFEIESPLSLLVALDSIRHISCFGLEDGYLKVEGSGGTPPYQYQWNTGSTSPVVPNLDKGLYLVTITDFNGCSSIQPYAIDEPEALDLALISVTEPDCIGDSYDILDSLIP